MRLTGQDWWPTLEKRRDEQLAEAAKALGGSFGSLASAADSLAAAMKDIADEMLDKQMDAFLKRGMSGLETVRKQQEAMWSRMNEIAADLMRVFGVDFETAIKKAFDFVNQGGQERNPLRFHQGGIVPGVPGHEVPALLLPGERVTRPGQSVPGGGTYNTFNFYGNVHSERDAEDVMVRAYHGAQRRNLI
jgi:hypothetical protein